MTKIQFTSGAYDSAYAPSALPPRTLHNGDVYGFSTEAPTGTEYVNGGTGNNYHTAWAFKTPLTVRFYDYYWDEEYKYLTYTTYWR
jgi:hypothetical protein